MDPTRTMLAYIAVGSVLVAGVAGGVAVTDAPAENVTETPTPTETPTVTETPDPPSTANDQLYPRGHPCGGQHYPQEDCPPVNATHA